MHMTLYEAQKGCSYCIEGLYVEPAITRRLQALGLNDGTVINVLNRKKKGALIIQVRGTRLALGKHISSSIEISHMPGAPGVTAQVSCHGKKQTGEGRTGKAEGGPKGKSRQKNEPGAGEAKEAAKSDASFK